MKRSTSAIIDEYTNVLNGYVGLYSYRLVNLCIKADPVSLLGVTVDIEGMTMNIEDVAMVGEGEDEFKINVYPNDEKNTLMIGKAIAMEHVEFIQELETMTLDDGEEIRYIKLTMPEVNEDRMKVMTNAVKMLHDDCVAKLKASTAFYTGKLTIDQIGASAEDVEEAKKKFEEVTESSNKSCEDITTDKNKEIEEAYQNYLAKKHNMDEQKEEADDAEGLIAKNTLKYN